MAMEVILTLFVSCFDNLLSRGAKEAREAEKEHWEIAHSTRNPSFARLERRRLLRGLLVDVSRFPFVRTVSS